MSEKPQNLPRDFRGKLFLGVGNDWPVHWDFRGRLFFGEGGQAAGSLQWDCLPEVGVTG